MMSFQRDRVRVRPSGAWGNPRGKLTFIAALVSCPFVSEKGVRMVLVRETSAGGPPLRRMSLVVGLLAACLSLGAAAQGGGASQVLPPDVTLFGKKLEDWAVDWGRWA